MKRLCVLAAVAMAFASCGKDFSVVEHGQTSEQVRQLVGEPKQVIDNFFVREWIYDTHLVSFDADADTVVKVQSIKEMKLETQKMEEEINKLRENL